MTEGATARIYEGEDEGRRKWRKKRELERKVCVSYLDPPPPQNLFPIPPRGIWTPP